MDTIYQWLQNHVAICTWIVALCALATFLFNFVFKKKKKEDKPSQQIGDVKRSNVNQAGGNITINGR